jgi:hypothetical protein
MREDETDRACGTMVDMRKAYKIFVRKAEGLSIKETILLKWILKETGWGGSRLDLSGSGQ